MIGQQHNAKQILGDTLEVGSNKTMSAHFIGSIDVQPVTFILSSE